MSVLSFEWKKEAGGFFDRARSRSRYRAFTVAGQQTKTFTDRATITITITESQLADREFYSKYGQNTQPLQAQLRTVRENVSQLYSRSEELELIRAES